MEDEYTYHKILWQFSIYSIKKMGSLSVLEVELASQISLNLSTELETSGQGLFFPIGHKQELKRDSCLG